MERFVLIVSVWKPLTIITKRSIFDVAAALDPPLESVISLSIVFFSFSMSVRYFVVILPFICFPVKALLDNFFLAV